MNINPLERISNRNDLECPGDTIPYNCTIVSNSEFVHLIWRVTLPGLVPIKITYVDVQNGSNVSSFNSNIIATSLEQYSQDQYISSRLELTIQANFSIDQTQLECSIGNIGNDSVVTEIDSSGKLFQILRPTWV